MNLIAERLNNIRPSPTLAMTSKAIELKAKGINIIGLAAGEPDFDTPQHIKDAAIQGMQQGFTKYTSVEGLLTLRTAIIDKFKRENHLYYEPNQIIVGCGAKHVLYNALIASINPGDEVIIPTPYWVSYVDIAALAEARIVTIESSAENNFKMTPMQLEAAITPKTKWLILNSPSNPTGSVYSFNELKELSLVLLKHPHVHILSDDIYEHIIYDEEFFNIAQVEPKLFKRTLTLNGVSKSYAMTGWRIGYAGGSPDLINAMTIIQSQNTSSACSISQIAAIQALNGPQDFISTNCQIFLKRRNLVMDMLKKTEFLKVTKPAGAFYMFIDCKNMFNKTTKQGKILLNSEDVTEYLLEQALVAVIPGSAFGMEGYFRISYATSEENLIEACNRMITTCNQL